MIDLDQIAKNDKPQFGELKMTIAQFFRINGGTTQLRGVTPDIVFPSISDDGELRRIELRQRAALDADQAGGLSRRRATSKTCCPFCGPCTQPA